MTDEKPRTLTDEESAQLHSKLSTCLLKNSDGSTTEEDANDLLDYALAMVTNGKSVDYIVNDLKNMGMDHICDEDASVKIGKMINEFLNKDNSAEVTDQSNIISAGTPTTNTSKKIISLKSKTENALTMSGALGSAKKKEKKDDKKGNALTMSGALGTSRDGSKKETKKENKQNDNPGKNKGSNNRNNNNKNKRVGDGRSIASEAFKKLTQQRDNDNNFKEKKNMRNGSGSGNAQISGRGGRGRDHNDERNSGRGGQRGAGGPGRGRGGGRGDMSGRHDNEQRLAGQKRMHDETQSYSERQRGGRGDQDFGRGRGRGRGDQSFGRGAGRGRSQWQSNNIFEHNKRSRHEDHHSETAESYNQSYQNEWHTGGRGRGMSGGRGRGRDNSTTHESTQAAAEVSPSPLVAAEFGTKLSYSGRGNLFRGGGRGFGRGRGFPGRTNVAAMLAAKTWTRSKANEGDNAEPGTGTGAE